MKPLQVTEAIEAGEPWQEVENVASGSEVRKRREGGKKLGWGDKKPPPLNYKPWYSIFTW